MCYDRCAAGERLVVASLMPLQRFVSALKLPLLAVLIVGSFALAPSEQASAEGGLTFTQLSAGYAHTCAVTTEGGVWCWGAGYLGNTPHPEGNHVPVPALGLEDGVVAVSSGYWHTCALLATGGLKCWGQNREGQLGVPTTENCNTPEYPTPCARTPVNGPSLGTDVWALAAGGYHTCALTVQGKVKCWGSNEYGQLGNGTTTDSMMPVDVFDSAGAPLTGVAAITGGEGFTCALTARGTAKCWGENDKGQLGDGTTTDRSLAADVVGLGEPTVAVVSGPSSYTTCAVTMSGAAKCWGDGSAGQLGNGTRGTGNHSAIPVDVTGLGSGVVALTTGYLHTCALMTGGRAKCWGDHGFRQLGHNAAYSGFSAVPVDVCRTYNPSIRQCDQLESGLTNIAAGGFHTCGLPAAGTGIRCWGTDVLEQIGCRNCVTPTTPVVDVQMDSDADGLLDSRELTISCLNWKIPDATIDQDQDGLSTFDELNRRYAATDPCDPDTDNDGCEDGPENIIIFDPALAYLPHNPLFFWDFFDTPEEDNLRDGIVSISDVVRVIARFGATGDASVDPLSAASPPPAYHTAFDRSSISGRLAQADGSIGTGDIALAVKQFGLNCG